MLVLKNKISFSLFTFFIILCLQISAIDPQIPLKQCILDEWNTVNGISNECVNSITQSNNGLLWIATFNGGIVTFDGKNFESVDLGRLYFSNTFKVYTDKNDKVWIGRSPGVICYHPDTGEYNFVKNKENDHSIASCIVEDHTNNLWIGTEASSLLRLKNGKSEPYLSDEDRKKIPFITSAFTDSYGNLWITAHDKGLFNITNRKFIKRESKLLEPGTVFYAITEDKEKRLIVGTDRGVLLFDSDNKEKLITKKDGLVNNSVNCLLTDSDGNIFVGTQKGLSRIQFKSNGDYVIDNILPDNCINCLYEGKEGSLWIGTVSSGLKRLRKPVLKTYSINEGLPYLDLAIYKDRNKNIWIGTQYGTIYRYINKKFVLFAQLPPKYGHGITSIGQDKAGRFIIGTVYAGIYILKNKEFSHIPGSEGPFRYGVHFIQNDKNGNVWLGSFWGLFRLKNKKIEQIHIVKNREFFSTYDAVEINNDELWVAGRYGVFVLKNGILTKTLIDDRAVTKIYKDKFGIVWLGTFHGLLRLDGKQKFIFNENHGLASRAVFGIKEDGLGNLWISGKNGIQRLSLNRLRLIAEGKESRVEGVRFGISEGMLSDKCSKFSKNGILEPEVGKLWFSTNKGIVEFDSLKLKINKIPPGILIREVLINSNRVPYSKDQMVFNGIKNISFSIAVSSFISPENVRIKYRLNGYDKKWNEFQRDKQRLISYYNLPEGKYSLQVIAANSHGVWNSDGDHKDFIIKTPIFETKGFKYILIFFILGLILISLFSIKKFLYYKKISNKYKKSNLDDEETKVVLDKINNLIIEDKIYLENDISMQNLAKNIGIPSHKLSQILNEKMNMSFWDLINSYRIKEAKELLCHDDTKGLTVLEIAFRIGFNSNVSFNRAFKKITKITPTQYRKKCDQSK